MATFPLSDLLNGGTQQLRTEMVKTNSVSATLQNAVSASSPGLDFTVDGYGVANLQITGTFVATVTFYGSVDGTNFVNISAYDRNLKNEILSTTNTGIFEINCRGLKTIRAAVTWTSGTSVTVVGVAEPFSGQNHNTQLTGSTLRQTQISTDQTVTWANSAAVNTQNSVVFTKPTDSIAEYELIVYNPSTVTDVTVKIFAVELALGGASRDALITSVSIPKSQAQTGTTINTQAKFLHGIFNGADCKFVLSNDTVLGVADGFSAYLRVREC